MKEQLKAQIKLLRVNIDGLAQLAKELKPIEVNMDDYIMSYSDLIEYPNLKQNLKLTSKQIEKAVDSLYLAKAWLGKLLGEFGEENPYKSGYKTKEDIEPTADVAKVEPSADNFTFTKGATNWELWNHIEKVDWLRQEIGKVIEEIKKLTLPGNPPRGVQLQVENVFTYLCEARFWLGFELERIKGEK